MPLLGLTCSSTASAAAPNGGDGARGGGTARRCCSAPASAVARRRAGGGVAAVSASTSSTSSSTDNTCSNISSSADTDTTPAPAVTRRRVLFAATTAAVAAAATTTAPQAALAEAAEPPSTTSPYYADDRQAYRIIPPANWELKQKAGADALWEDPARRSSSLGVTVAPVRVPSLAAFGPLDAVGARLLDAERRKESTKSVTMLRQEERGVRGVQGAEGGGGAAASSSPSSSPSPPVSYYCYEYDLDSTRGRKRILNVVTIAGSRLYIVNGQVKCAKVEGDEGAASEGGAAAAACERGDGVASALAALRASAASFEVISGGGR